MPNGKQVGDENFQKFLSWQASRTEEDFRQLERRGILNRTEIHKECGFSRSVLSSNPDVKRSLRVLEEDLRKRGVLPLKAEQDDIDDGCVSMREAGAQRAAFNAERMRRLEQENASLRNELYEVKRQLEQYTTLQQALSLTGRLPR